MTQVGIKQLKDNLSRYLKKAEEGERIVVTDRGRPIAVISGLDESEETNLAWQKVEKGLASWSGGKPAGLSEAPVIEGKSTADVVIEDRQ
jgi:prevent-host-death family protein